VIEDKIGSILKQKGLKIGIAESCTGGLIASRITDVSGASEYFDAGFITYSNNAKTRFLSVPEELISQKGAVSMEVAKSMAYGAKQNLGVDIGVAVTGIAGPMGGSADKPVGTVYIGIAVNEGVFVRHFLFNGDRIAIKQQTCDAALTFVLDYLEGRVH